jgi:23S rRNA pseudouridine2605 synthase
MSSEGLILVTNDGELADRLTHPRYGVPKTYHVEVAGTLAPRQLERLRRGVHLAEGFARVVSAEVLRAYRHSTLLEIVLAEGRNREIRRILARVGHKVERLRRVAIGPLRLADLPLGAARPLERDEVRRLKRFSPAAARKAGGGRKRRAPRATAARPVPRRSIIGGDQPAQTRRAKIRRPAQRRLPNAAGRGRPSGS